MSNSNTPIDINLRYTVKRRRNVHIGLYGPATVDFSWIDETVNFGHLVAVLRTSFIWKHKIKHWDHALSVAGQFTLNNKELEPELFGLI